MNQFVPANTIEQFFHIRKNALSPEVCQRAIELFEQSEHKVEGKVGDGTRSGAYRPDIKSTTEIMLNEHTDEWGEVLEAIVANLKSELKSYLDRFPNIIHVPIYPEEFRIAKYDIGGIFDWHSDNIGSDITRVITAIWYLNDVPEGGETHYLLQGVKVKPEQGKMMLCPVGWPFVHKGEAPVSNPKYMIITQLHQKVDNP